MKRPSDRDFAPKIFIVGRKNELVSPLIQLILEDEQNRFGVRSAGIEPSGRLDSGLKDFLAEYESEDVDPASLESTPISVGLDDHVQLVAFTEPSVREEGPIIATPGDKVTLETGELRECFREASTPDEFRELFEELRDRVTDQILTTLGIE